MKAIASLQVIKNTAIINKDLTGLIESMRMGNNDDKSSSSNGNSNNAPGNPQFSTHEQVMFDEITKLNNELLNITRELTKKNIALNKANKTISERLDPL